MRVDALDLRILRDIGLEPFAGKARSPHPWRPEELALRLRENPRLVKDRMARMERDGVIAAFDVQPNLALLGLASRTYAFPFQARADRAKILERLIAIDGMLAYVDYLTDWVTTTFAYANESEHAERLGQVRAVLGGLEPDTWFELAPQAPARELTRLDWRVVRALRGDARAPLSDLAERVGISTKTVQRHLDRLAAEGAFSTFARLHEKSLDELLMCSLIVTVDMARVGDAMGELHGKLLADAWAHCSAPLIQAGVHYDLIAAPRTPRGLAELLEATAKIPGVLDVRGHLATSVTWTPRWLDAQIDVRIAALPP